MQNDDELDFFFNQNKKNGVQVTVQTQKSKETSQKKLPQNQKSTTLETKAQPTQQQKTIPMISMKAFIFNFKQFYKKKTKIRNLISENSAKQRNISICIYLRNYFNSYKSIKTMLLQTSIQEVRMQQRFEDLAFRNISDQQSAKIYVKNQETDIIAEKCRESMQTLFLRKESAFYEKRVICKFLNSLFQNEKYTPLGYLDILRKYKDQLATNSAFLNNIGNFIKKLQVHIKGNSFKLVDVAHFLYEQKFRRSDVDQIMKFISKAKEMYNKTNNQEKSATIDGDKLLPLDLLQNTFLLLTNKEKTNSDLLKDLINKIRSLINELIKINTLERVQKVMEQNIIGDYLQKYFADLDSQISNLLTYIEKISSTIYNIDALNLSTKQDQLEVLLCFILKIQDLQFDETTVGYITKHSKILDLLLNQLEHQLVEAKLKKAKLKKKDEQILMPAVKKVLYEDDLRDEGPGENQQYNPYNIKTSDLPVRQPKILNMQEIKPSFLQISNLNELQQAEQFIDGYIENEYDRDEFVISQIQLKQQKSPSNTYKQPIPVSDDLLYEKQFDKLLHESKANSKDELIFTLKNQINQLKEQVSQYKK